MHCPKISLNLFMIAFMIVGIFDTSEVFWSLFIYSVSVTYLNVGIASTLIKLGIILANLIIGVITDNNKWFVPAILALIVFSALWILRLNTQNVYIIFVISVASGFMLPFFLIPTFSKFISYARNSQNLPIWLAYREISLKTGGVFSILLALLIPIFTLTAPFLFSAIGSLGFIGVLKKMQHKSANN